MLFFCLYMCMSVNMSFMPVCIYVLVCGLGHTTASDTLTWLKMHGTAVDNTSLVTSMLSRGQMVVLTGIHSTFPYNLCFLSLSARLLDQLTVTRHHAMAILASGSETKTGHVHLVWPLVQLNCI